MLAARDPDALAPTVGELRALGATTVEVGARSTRRDTARTPAFVDDVFERFGDIDLALLAFGVLGDQEEAERDAAAAVDIASINYVGTVSVARAARATHARAGPRHDRRVVVGRRRAGARSRTSSTARRRRAWTRSSRASATASWAPACT